MDLFEKQEKEAAATMARVTASSFVMTWVALWCGCRWRRMLTAKTWHLAACPFSGE